MKQNTLMEDFVRAGREYVQKCSVNSHRLRTPYTTSKSLKRSLNCGWKDVLSFFLIPTLFFRKIKGKSNLNSKISFRLNQWHNSQRSELVADLERDSIHVHGPDRETNPSRPKSVKEFNVRRGVELIAEMSRGSKALLSKGVSSANDNEAIRAQMEAKFPRRKKEIRNTTEEQWEHERASIDRDILRKCILKLKGQVSPGLTGFRNEHIQALIFSEQSNADFLAKSAFDELHAVANDIVQGRLPWYFYQV